MAPPSRERIVLLFCHGGSFHKEIWTPIVRRLQASALLQRVPCECVAIDWRYHGAKSTDVDAATLYYEGGDKKAPRVEHPGRHWPEWAPPDLRQTIEELRREDKTLNRTTRIVGIGHSMGAATLLNVEVHQPGTFSGLVLFEPPFAVGERPEVLSKAASVMVLNTMGRPQEWNTWAEVVDHFKTNPMYRRWHPESLEAFLAGGIKKTADEKRFRLAMPLIQEASLYCHELMCFAKHEIGNVACPVVFEFGDHTRLFNLPLAMDVAAALPNRFSIGEPLEGLSHLTIAEDPDMCAAHILVNLEKLPVFQDDQSKKSKL